ncbi:fimbria/pilus outer membrane usher protein [Lysobacter maris]|uniref:Fimbria/pilus outer membrane usher protein n=1 Tax=Marilutibacter maris TaxID=1605891 RepID=A0A508AZN9_9GAMM|nr:fimbria/pilus outer membrane usher protein [Lysobacter maris]KAB8192931.1 fimbria/pilus outer membrane usher protein [Lysobacter maris]
MRWRSSALLLGLAAAPPIAMAGPAPAGTPHPGHDTLYLEVVLNRTARPGLVRFLREGSRFRVDAAELRRLGLVLEEHAVEEHALEERAADEGVADGHTQDGHPAAGTIALDAIADIHYRYDAPGQRMFIELPPSRLDLPTTVIGTTDRATPPLSEVPTSLLFNYDLHADHDDRGNSQLGTVGELRLSGLGAGVFSTSAVNRLHRRDHGRWHTTTTRLDTRWELSFPEHALTVRAGDIFSGFLDWTRPVRMGGVQVGRNFGLQPYRVTTPLPAFLGEVAVPSAVDLYVNGMRQYSGQLPVGPFELSTAPGINGAGNASVVITDAFGRTRTLELPFYSTPQLLARGLSDWSLSVGTVRERYGLTSFAYASEPVASASLRYGIADPFTVELHAETGDGLVNAGLGGVWLLGRAGVLNASHTRSRQERARGSQSGIGYRWNNGRFNFSADGRRTDGDYRDIASLYGPPPPTVSTRMLAGITSAALGNVGITHVRLRHPDPDIAPARYAGLFWTRNFAHRWSASLSYNENLDDADDRSVYLQVSAVLDGNRQLGSAWQREGRRDNARVEFIQPVPGDGGFGWRVRAHDGDDGAGGAVEAGWLLPRTRVGIGLARIGDTRRGYAQASGGVVLMDGHAFAARRIDDAFAVVSTDGVADVPVLLENRAIGRTDADGMLLVTPLNAWQRNRLSIDPMSLPVDMRIDTVERIATPGDRAGTRVRFAIAPVRAAVIVLHDGAGQPLPLRSRVRLAGSDADTIVGHDGETYLDTLDAHNRLSVRTPSGGICHVDFDYPQGADPIPRIGPLRCLQEAEP